MCKDTIHEAAKEIAVSYIEPENEAEGISIIGNIASIIRDVVKRVIETEKDRIPTAAYRRLLDRIREGDN